MVTSCRADPEQFDDVVVGNILQQCKFGDEISELGTCGTLCGKIKITLYVHELLYIFQYIIMNNVKTVQ